MSIDQKARHSGAQPFSRKLCSFLTGTLLLLTLVSVWATAQDDSLSRGIQAFEDENYEQAISLLSRYASEESSPRAYMYLGHAYYFTNAYDKARSMYKNAQDHGLSDAQANVYRARITIAEGDYDAALDTLRPLVGHDDVGALALKLVARALEQSDLYDLSSHVYRRIYTEESAGDAVLKKLYSLSVKQRDFDRASQYARSLLERNPLDPELLLFNASSALERGKVRSAEVDLELARRLGHIDAELFRTLADIKSKRKNFPEAIHYYKLLINTIDSPSPRDLYRLGISYLETDQFDEAEDWLFRAAEKNPSYLSGVLRLIRHLQKNRPFEQVQKRLENARSRFPDADKIRVLEGNLYLKQEAPEQSFVAFSHLDPSSLNDRDTLYNYAYAAVQSNHREKALEILTHAIARYPDHQPFRRLLDQVIRE